MWRKFNKPLLAKIRRASREYGLIQPYDKIAVGLSGGKDSTVLLYALSVLQKTLPFPFELHGISLDVGWNNNYEIVGEYCRSWACRFIWNRPTSAASCTKNAKSPTPAPCAPICAAAPSTTPPKRWVATK